MIKRILTIFLAVAAGSVFGLGFYVGNHDDKQPEGGYKTSTCPWGRSLHYQTDLYRSKPGIADTIVGRGGQTIEIDQNLSIGGISSIVSKLIFAKGKTIKLRDNIRLEVKNSKMLFEDCTVDVGKNLEFPFWHKSTVGGISTLEIVNSKVTFGGGMICIIPIHPDAKFNGYGGPNIVLKGGSQLYFGTGLVIDEIFYEIPSSWKCTFKFVPSDGKVPTMAVKGNFTTRGITFEFDTQNAGSVRPGVYTLLNLMDKDAKFLNPKFFLNGSSYSMGGNFKIGGKSAKIDWGASPNGKDTATANDIILTVSK